VKRICCFHAGCPDGFGAAWAVWKAWGGAAEYRPCGHQEYYPADAWSGATVVFVDIMPPIRSLRDLSRYVSELYVLDHHLTAERRWKADAETRDLLAARGHEVHLDLDHSGAVLAWQHFHPTDRVPDLLRYVEDLDLWRFELPRSEAVSAAINSYPRSFEVWNRLAGQPIRELAEQGEPILRAERTEVQRALRGAHKIRVEESFIEAVNATEHRSRIGHALALRRAFDRRWGLVYRLRGRRVDASLYSIGDLDVASVAARFGGGGHRNAAGFQVDLDRWLAEFVKW